MDNTESIVYPPAHCKSLKLDFHQVWATKEQSKFSTYGTFILEVDWLLVQNLIKKGYGKLSSDEVRKSIKNIRHSFIGAIGAIRTVLIQKVITLHFFENQKLSRNFFEIQLKQINLMSCDAIFDVLRFCLRRCQLSSNCS